MLSFEVRPVGSVLRLRQPSRRKSRLSDDILGKRAPVAHRDGATSQYCYT